MPAGRPSKYKPEYAEQARKLCAMKAFTDIELAQFFDTTEQTINAWKKKYPKFLEALKTGKHISDSEVERSLYERATGYTCDDVHITNYQGKVTITPIKKHYPPDPTSMIFWLKNRKKKEWRDRIDHTHEGPEGGPIETIVHVIVDPKSTRNEKVNSREDTENVD